VSAYFGGADVTFMVFNASGDPVVVFVSYFYVYLDDKLRKTPEKRAASLLKSLLAFRDLVELYVALRSIYLTEF
jgi:hypothetical protein